VLSVAAAAELAARAPVVIVVFVVQQLDRYGLLSSLVPYLDLAMSRTMLLMAPDLALIVSALDRF
jgi:hypothetical protein